MINFIIVLGVGIIVILFGIVLLSQWIKDSILFFFLKYSYDFGGGDNVVNVIFVDFRGFDIMFEIMVLMIVVFGIYSMIKIKVKEEGKSGE